MIFIGESGAGKTMLATGLALCAGQQGRRVSVTTLAALANEASATCGSLVVTTDLGFGEWTKVFPDPQLAESVVDRITHKAHPRWDSMDR